MFELLLHLRFLQLENSAWRRNGHDRTALYYTLLHSTVLQYASLHSTVQHYTVLHRSTTIQFDRLRTTTLSLSHSPVMFWYPSTGRFIQDGGDHGDARIFTPLGIPLVAVLPGSGAFAASIANRMRGSICALSCVTSVSK